MTRKARDKIAAGLREAIAVAQGKEEPVRLELRAEIEARLAAIEARLDRIDAVEARLEALIAALVEGLSGAGATGWRAGEPPS